MLKSLDKIGTLKVGKQADIVMIRADDLNMQPVHNPVSTAVMQTSLANIDSVMIAGQWKKRAGKLLDVDLTPMIAALNASGKKITSALGIN
jgi:cytosine/adenosine deaminase-related metal-dependent hydrolase